MQYNLYHYKKNYICEKIELTIILLSIIFAYIIFLYLATISILQKPATESLKTAHFFPSYKIFPQPPVFPANIDFQYDTV